MLLATGVWCYATVGHCWCCWTAGMVTTRGAVKWLIDAVFAVDFAIGTDGLFVVALDLIAVLFHATRGTTVVAGAPSYLALPAEGARLDGSSPWSTGDGCGTECLCFHPVPGALRIADECLLLLGW